MSLTLNLVSLVLALAAFGASTFLLFRQTAFLRHANELPISIDLYQEFRSHEFQEAYGFVLNSLSSNYDSSSGISGLPEEARIPSLKVATFFTSLGGLVSLGMADERFAVPFLGTAANITWEKLGPYIAREREIRGDDDVLAFYEDFVSRVRENWPLKKAYGLEFKRLAGGPRDGASTIPPPLDQPSS